MTAIGGVLLALVGAPLVGGLLFGCDRILTARLQRRIGPPLTQPFHDVVKLLGKSRQACNSIQVVCASLYLAAMALSLLLLVMGQDMLVLLFIMALGTILLILGAYSVKSPYSQLGAQREVFQLLAYEPMLVFMVVAAYLATGSFRAASVFALHRPLLVSLPLFLVTQTLVLSIKLHKSPFDISASHHAHQELVRGIYTEYSGLELALIELAHWYELVLMLGFVALLWHTNLVVGLAIALLTLLVVIVVDNITARMTWRWMLGFCWVFGGGLAFVNVLALYLQGR